MIGVTSLEKLYKYWFFLIKGEYANKLPITSLPVNRATLFAYTDKKELAKLFLKLHKKEVFIIKKQMISREVVNDLAKNYQNNIIRKVNMTTKDIDNQMIEIDVAITEVEGILTENRCYSMVEYLYKYAWNSNECLRDEYKEALDILGYTNVHNSLLRGDSIILPKMLQEDLFGALINAYGSIMEVRL